MGVLYANDGTAVYMESSLDQSPSLVGLLGMGRRKRMLVRTWDRDDDGDVTEGSCWRSWPSD